MIDIALQMFIQLIGLLPGVFAIYLVFDFIGSLIFNK